MSTNFLYAHAYCGISARDIGTHISKVCNASKKCAMSDLICVTSSRSFLSSFASSVTAVSWRSTACSILPLSFTSFTGFKSRTLPCCFWLLVLFSVLRICCSPPLVAPIMGSHVSGCQAANRLIETVIAPNFCRCHSLGLMPAMETGVNDHVLEFGRGGFLMIHAAQNIVGAVQIQCCVKRSSLRSAKPIVRMHYSYYRGENGFAQSPRLP
jgi:hypothetical protein